MNPALLALFVYIEKLWDRSKYSEKSEKRSFSGMPKISFLNLDGFESMSNVIGVN